MNTELLHIQDFVKAFVNAIAAILNVDVTVVDRNIFRIAATSKNHQINQKIRHASLYQEMLVTKQPSIIENSHISEICSQCGDRFNCSEVADIAYPIFYQNEVCGIISIAAFSEEERLHFLQNKTKFEQFLKYMSMLIESKIDTLQHSQKLENQLDEVIKSFNDVNFIGETKKVKHLLALANKINDSDSTVLIMGESGTGKEVLANVIHNQSTRKNKLMISVNCSAIPENLVESELFGYEPGAFTGANPKGYVGKFELANKSTLFLDEIGDMPLVTQTKLLRVLQEKTVTRLCSNQRIPIDVRVICATNQDLDQLIQDGKFRRDLYYRINVIPMLIPPLRQRRDDIPLLAEFLIVDYNKKFRKNITISPQAMDSLIAYNWPGNVRELKNIIEYLLNIKEYGQIMLADLPSHIMFPNTSEVSSEKEFYYLKNLLEEYEKHVIKQLLKNAVTTEDKKNVAKKLGIGLSTLYKKIELYNI